MRGIGKLIVAIAAMLAPAMQIRAQKIVDEAFIETRGGFHSDISGTSDVHRFTGDYFNVQMMGHLTGNLSYRIRHRLIKQVYNEHNHWNATDFMWLTWQASPKLSFTAGKHPVFVGGYEYEASPIDVYYWSRFCLGLYQFYTFGVSGMYDVAPGQSIGLQFSESPLSRAFSNIFACSAMWRGSIAPWWSTIWSLNYFESEYEPISYITLGNSIQAGNLNIELDFQNRASFDQKQYFFSDWTLSTRLLLSISDRWNLYSKFGYDTNDEANINHDCRAYDLAVPPGTEYVFAGGGVEFFPLGNKDLRVHAIYNWNNAARNIHTFDIGLTYYIRIIKRN